MIKECPDCFGEGIGPCLTCGGTGKYTVSLKEQGLAFAQELSDKQKVGKVKTWTTRDGYVLKIKQMRTDHIFNCLALLYKKEAKERPEYQAFLKELFRRGELDLSLQK